MKKRTNTKKIFLVRGFPNSNKGLSVVIATVLLVALTVVLAGIVWTIVNNLIGEGIEKSDACLRVFEKVSLNDKFTCYDDFLNELHFSISVGDIEVDEIFVGISAEEESRTLKISKKGSNIDHLKMYDGTKEITAPGKDSGLTYIYDLTSAGLTKNEPPRLIQIAPVIKGIQCEVSDLISDFKTCD